MKEFIIVFVVAMVVTSLFNGWNPFASTTPVPVPQEQSVTSAPQLQGATNDQQGFNGASAQASGQAAPQSGTGSTPGGNAL